MLFFGEAPKQGGKSIAILIAVRFLDVLVRALDSEDAMGGWKNEGGWKTRHRQVTDLDVTVLGFSGPGLPSARQVLCGDAPRLFSLILVSI